MFYYLSIDWKVIGEGLCAPTLNSKSLTGEEYSFTSPSSEDYLAYNSEPSLTPYVESSSYSGQEYTSPPPSPCTDQDLSENYMAPAPPLVSYAIPDTVPVPSTYEVPTIQPTLRSASASDPLAYIGQDRSQSYEAHAPAPYGRLDQSQNYLPHAVPAPVPDLCPYAAPTPYVTLDQTQNYGTPAEAPKSYPVPEVIASPAPYEEQQPYLYPAPMPSVVSAPYTPLDKSPNFVVPAPVPGAYLGQDFVPAPYIPVRYTPVSASYQAPYPIANPVPASAPTPCSSLDQGQNYTAIVTGPASYAAQNAILYPYGAEKTAPYPNAAVSSPSTQVHSAISAPPPISYLYDVQQTAPYPYPYSAPADLQYTIPDHSQGYPATPTSASYTNIERTPAYQAQLPAACSCTARHATNTPVYPVPNQYTKTVASSTLLSNIYSRLPGSLDLTNLFKQLRRCFRMFIYRPSYTHIIITN